MLKTENLAEVDYDKFMSEEERLAWNHPRRDTYHSFHVEKLNNQLFLVRDSRRLVWYIVNHDELADLMLNGLQMRKLDPDYQKHLDTVTTLRILSQQEVDNLLADL